MKLDFADGQIVNQSMNYKPNLSILKPVFEVQIYPYLI